MCRRNEFIPPLDSKEQSRQHEQSIAGRSVLQARRRRDETISTPWSSDRRRHASAAGRRRTRGSPRWRPRGGRSRSKAHSPSPPCSVLRLSCPGRSPMPLPEAACSVLRLSFERCLCLALVPTSSHCSSRTQRVSRPPTLSMFCRLSTFRSHFAPKPTVIARRAKFKAVSRPEQVFWARPTHLDTPARVAAAALRSGPSSRPRWRWWRRAWTNRRRPSAAGLTRSAPGV